jgi:N-acetyl-gamma-glutamylphosphate reductase
MKFYSIIGERSKIGKCLIKYMPKGYKRIPESQIGKQLIDVVFLATGTDKAKSLIKKNRFGSAQIIDLSGSQKLESYIGRKNQKDFEFIYGLPELNKPGTKKNIATPGCSSMGILTVLLPIQKYIEKDVFVDVKFSKSAMRFLSENQSSLKNNIKIVHPLSHLHQTEINYVLSGNLKVSLATNLIDIERGISLNIFTKLKRKADVEKELKRFYKNTTRVKIAKNPVDLLKVIGTHDIQIYVKQEGSIVLINAVFDNLTFGAVDNALAYLDSV